MNIDKDALLIILTLGLFLETAWFSNLFLQVPLLINAWLLTSIVVLCTGLVILRKYM